MVIKEVEYRDTEVIGRVLYIKMYREGYPALSWREVWEAFSMAYPNRWAVQCFPPSSELVDGKAVYHLFVCDHDLTELNIRREGT